MLGARGVLPGLTMAGPGAIASCEEAVSREAANLEDSLIQTGALTGIQHKFIVRQGDIWPELREIIRQERTDLLVVGTHGRHGIGKLFFGSVAEQIFRQAECPVLTFGPHSQEYPWVGTTSRDRTFLFATDFGQASLHGLTPSDGGCQSLRSQARLFEHRSGRAVIAASTKNLRNLKRWRA